MNFHLTPDLIALQQKVRQFVTTELLPLEVETELTNGQLPSRVRNRLRAQVKELGLNAIALPQAMGGRDFSWLAQTVVNEEMGKATNALGWIMWDPALALAHATPDQVERYVRPTCDGARTDCYAITEPNAGSDPATLETTAVRDGDDWVLNGEKWHVTFGDIADYALVQAATSGEGEGGTLFFVDFNLPGVEKHEHVPYMHHLIVGHIKLILKNVRVPNRNVLGGVGGGLAVSKDWFRRERIMIAARCCGAAERLIDEASTFAQSRKQFGSPISEYQFIQGMLADSLTELWAARLMTYATAAAADEAAASGIEEAVKHVHIKASMAKLYASEMAGRVADRAVQIFGGRGYMRDNLAERFYRELRVERIWEGTSEIQRLIITNSLYKRGVEAHF